MDHRTVYFLMDYPSTAWTAVYYAAYPVVYILNLILAILAVFAAPLLHLSHCYLYACWYILCALGKFEVGHVKLAFRNTIFMGH